LDKLRLSNLGPYFLSYHSVFTSFLPDNCRELVQFPQVSYRQPTIRYRRKHDPKHGVGFRQVAIRSTYSTFQATAATARGKEESPRRLDPPPGS
jgi:hypothetical protein